MPTAARTLAARVRTARSALGCVGLGLSAASLACIGFGLPWQIRFPIVIAALLLGPGVPFMLLRAQLSAPKSIVAGIGVDVALLMLVAEGMVLAHAWWPSLTVGLVLLLSIVASARLLVMRAGPRGGPKCET